MKTPNVVSSELERETVRLTERYVSEVVVALDLCPWAAPALNDDRVQISVITDFFDMSSLPTAARHCQQRLLTTAPEIDLVLLVLPRLQLRRVEMDMLLAAVRDEMTAKEGVASFALAAFHPQADPDEASGERFIPFLRRSPDPLVQAVRFSSLERVDGKHAAGTTFLDPSVLDHSAWSGEPTLSLRARIARRNLDHVQGQGVDELKAKLDDICDDRRRTHRMLGLPARDLGD
jgi:hypothetical protein